MLAATLLELLAGAAIVFAALAYVVDRALDALGWSRSSRMLRVENEDYVRRDAAKEIEIRDLRREVARLEGEVQTLRTLVDDLSKRDQAAVLASIEQHETNAGSRHERMVGVLTEIRDAVKAA